MSGRLLALSLALVATGCDRLSSPNDFEGPGSPGDPGLPDGEGGAEHPAVGLVSVVPGVDRLRVEWRAVGLDPAPPAVALFFDEDEEDVFDQPPVPIDPTAGAALLEGLDPDSDHWVGIGVDVGGTGAYVPAGPLLLARTGAPVYADPDAPPGGDGSAPGSAFDDLFAAVLTAWAQGGGNVWIAEGSFTQVSLPLVEGVHLYGGFAKGFDLGERDTTLHPTVLRGRPQKSIVSMESSDLPAVIDGLVLDGEGVAADGLDLDAHPSQLRRLTIGACGRAAKFRAPATGPAVPVLAVRCTFGTSVVEGLSIDGPFDLTLEDCAFVENGQEGIDGDDLVAPDGGEARLTARDCRFADNQAEGLDVDLGAPPGGGPNGGLCVVLLEDCVLERNGGAGLLVDLDFELVPGWEAALELRGLEARANLGSGVHLDLDAPASALLHRVSCRANRGDGLLVTSESRPGTAVCSASALVGNDGAGARTAGGNVGLLLSHCVLSGNRLGSLADDGAPMLATSGVAYLEPAPWGADQAHHSPVTDETLPPPFERVPVQYLRVVGAAQEQLLVEGTPAFAPGAQVEVAEDGTPRAALAVGPGAVTVDPLAAGLVTPSVLGAFAVASGVWEDYRPAPGSPLLGAGMAPPGGAPVDAGPFGGPLGGAPGVEDLVPLALFATATSEPPWSLPVASDATLTLRFSGGAPDPATLPLGLSAVDAAGDPLPIDASIVGAELLVTAPGGWPDGARLELHGALASVAGLPLATPLAIPLRVAGG